MLGQVANVFACRSERWWPGRIGWGGNRYVLVAVAFELAVLCGFLFVPPVARVLGHAPPPAAGLLVAMMAIPAVLAADALFKARTS